MFIQKIDIDAASELKAPRKPNPKPLALKLAVGLAVTLACAAAMVPWTLLVAAWTGIALLASAARTVGRSIAYAGEAVVGR
jgi:hypothetical protein